MKSSLPPIVLHGIFVLSGISALIYQMVWQRALMTIYGSNIESVSMVVAAFLTGLGIGSLAGGWLSKRPGIPLVVCFGLAELGVGAYGLVSLRLFEAVGSMTGQASGVASGLLCFALVFVPTVLMGSTLPLLVAHQVRATAHVGRSVGRLYFVNTLGAAAGSFLSALMLLGLLGMKGSVLVAAALNVTAALVILLMTFRRGDAQYNRSEIKEDNYVSSADSGPAQMGFGLAMMWALVSGWITLSWEIVWVRVFYVASGSRAPGFGMMLGCYLLGLALGSWWCTRLIEENLKEMRRRMARWVFVSGVASFSVPFLTALCATWLKWWLGYGFVMAAGVLLGVTFPLLCHAAVPPGRESGSRLSFLYLANIAGSGAGSLLTGFWLLEHMSMSTLAFLLLGAGTLWALWISPVGPKLADYALQAVVMMIGLHVTGTIYERLQYRSAFDPANLFSKVIETRHGVVAVDKAGTVFGNGVYDAQIGTALEPGSWFVRPYFISAVRDRIEKVLVIGVASGSWTQVIVNHPQVKKVTAVEISEGYVELIRSRPEVRSLLTNPKFNLVIDDGRRWMRQHPNERFDAIIMNSTYHWREMGSALLSHEFLELVKSRLEPKGIAMWNCTGSHRAVNTGLKVFPHCLMLMNNILASNAALVPEHSRWEKVLSDYHIDGKPLFDLSTPSGKAALDGVLDFVKNKRLPKENDWWSWCDRAPLDAAFGGEEIITDDNLGHEYPFLGRF